MDRATRKRHYAITLERIAGILCDLPSEGFADRDLKIIRRTVWDLKQSARAIRAWNPTHPLVAVQRAQRPSRAKIKRPLIRPVKPEFDEFLTGFMSQGTRAPQLGPMTNIREIKSEPLDDLLARLGGRAAPRQS